MLANIPNKNSVQYFKINVTIIPPTILYDDNKNVIILEAQKKHQWCYKNTITNEIVEQMQIIIE